MLAPHPLLGPLVVAALVPATAAAQISAPDEPATGSSAPAASAPAPAARDGSSPLTTGASGARVTEVQKAMAIRADGTYGARTRKAVRGFQQAAGLPITGDVDAATAAALSLRGPRTLKALQRKLKLTTDGKLGPATRKAIRRAEKRAGLTADGIPDAQLLKRLGIGVAAPVVGGHASTSVQTAPRPAPAGAASWVAAARSQIGTPYAAGGSAPGGFDCSGLVFWALGGAGITVPRSSFEQYRIGAPVARGQLQPGDLVFFDTAGPGASDVGIASSSSTVISATTRGVKEHAVLTGYWSEHFVGARRL